MTSDKCMYFRKVAAVADDDDAAASCAFPVGSFKGASYDGSTNVLVFYFEGMHDYNPIADSNGQVDNIVVSIVSDLKSRIVLDSLTKEIQTGESPVIVIYDEVDDSSFLSNHGYTPSSYISSISSITINQD